MSTTASLHGGDAHAGSASLPSLTIGAGSTGCHSMALSGFAVSSFDEKCPFLAERVTNTQFVKYVGIMDRNVRYHEIGNQQLLEHIRSDVSLLYELSGGTAGQAGLLHRGTNELGFDAVEIDSFLGAEGTHDKRIEHFVGSLELFC